MKSHVKGTRGGRPSPLRLSQAVDELGSPPRPSRRTSARTVDRPSGPHSKDGPRQHWPSCSKRTENNVKAQPKLDLAARAWAFDGGRSNRLPTAVMTGGERRLTPLVRCIAVPRSSGCSPVSLRDGRITNHRGVGRATA